MKSRYREIFFFVEQFDGGYARDKFRQWKNTRNYMNKFCITEDDSFDIAGIFTMKNPSARDCADSNDDHCLRRMQEQSLTERKKVFENLAKASGIVHIFISGMLLYTEHEQKIIGSHNQKYNQSYVCLEYILPKCLSSVVFQNIKILRISVMELRIARETKPSMGFKIGIEDVEKFYKNEDNTKMSLNNQLDLFYKKCLQDSVENEVVYVFHAPLLTPDDFSIFQRRFVEVQGMSLQGMNRYYQQKYLNTLAELATIDDDEEEIFDWNRHLKESKILFENTITRQQDQHKWRLIKSKTQDYRLFIGYRATIEFSFDNGRTKWSKLRRIIKYMQNKLLWSQIWSGQSPIFTSSARRRRPDRQSPRTPKNARSWKLGAFANHRLL